MTNIRDVYRNIRESESPRRAMLNAAFYGLSEVEIDQHRSLGRTFYRGKVRDLVYSENSIRMVHSDRLTAFDRYIDLVPCKGIILNRISEFWLSHVAKEMPNHFVRAADTRSLEVVQTQPVKVEVIVRGFLAGSISRAYARGERNICGIHLPAGLETNSKFDQPIITPTTKAVVGQHDKPISAEEIIARGICSATEWQQISEYALRLFAVGTSVAADHGWTLVDTKYEFGRDRNGRIILIDEIHTPDSSRFWVTESLNSTSPQMLDKEIVRKWLLDKGFSGEGDAPKVPVDLLLQLGEVYLDVGEKFCGGSICC